MANEKDVFEVRYQEKYGKQKAFTFPETDDRPDVILGPEGFVQDAVIDFEQTHLDQLNEAFRLGYRAALMEKA